MTKGNAWVLGATGQIGRAAVRSLVEDGWEVTAASLGGGRDARWDEGVRTRALDRDAEERSRRRWATAATYWSTWWRTGRSTPVS